MKNYWVYLVLVLNCAAIVLAIIFNQPAELLIFLFITLMASHIVSAVKSKEISNKYKKSKKKSYYIDAMTIICLAGPFIDAIAIALILFVSTFYS